MASTLQGKRVAIIASKGFEQSELEQPLKALKKSGAIVEVVSPQNGTIEGWQEDDWSSDTVAVTHTFDEVDPRNYDALFIPGGVLNCDSLRMDEDAVEFVRSFFEQQKPVAAICHGPQLLIEADVVDGRRLTSYPSIRADLENAGAEWIEAEVVVDQGLVTSRRPADLPAFINKMIEEFGEGEHSAQHA